MSDRESTEWFIGNIPYYGEDGGPLSKVQFERFLATALAAKGVVIHPGKVRFMHDQIDPDKFLGWGFAEVELAGGPAYESDVLDALKEHRLEYLGRPLLIQKAHGKRREPRTERSRSAHP